MNITLFNNSYRIPFSIIDIDRGSYYKREVEGVSYLTMMIGVACDIPHSFSNIFYAMNLTLDLDNYIIDLD